MPIGIGLRGLIIVFIIGKFNGMAQSIYFFYESIECIVVVLSFMPISVNGLDQPA